VQISVLFYDGKLSELTARYQVRRSVMELFNDLAILLSLMRYPLLFTIPLLPHIVSTAGDSDDSFEHHVTPQQDSILTRIPMLLLFPCT
jgi:hypothetical protein